MPDNKEVSLDDTLNDTIRHLLTELNSTGERPIHESLIVEGLNFAFRPSRESPPESINELLETVVLDLQTPANLKAPRSTFGSLLAAYRGDNPTPDDRAKLGLALFVKVILSISSPYPSGKGRLAERLGV
jgi:hypothetical protein